MRARDNPFRVDRQHALAFRFRETSADQLIEQFARLQWRGAIIGPHGSGKTTLQQLLAESLEQQGWRIHSLRLPEMSAAERSVQVRSWLESAPPEALLILDGAEQISRRQWREVEAFSGSHRGLLITAHQAGLLPTLYECRSDELLLEDLVRELVGPTAVPSEESLQRLLEECDGNIRDCFRRLYEEWAARPPTPEP